MSEIRLLELDRRSVAIEFCVAGVRRVVKGKSRLVRTGEGDEVLRVAIERTGESFEFIFSLAEFDGTIATGDRFECEYVIQLDEMPCQSAAA